MASADQTEHPAGLKILKLKWDLAEEYVRAAKDHLHRREFESAMAMCKQALVESPGFFPAIALEHEIRDQRKISLPALVSAAEPSIQAPQDPPAPVPCAVLALTLSKTSGKSDSGSLPRQQNVGSKSASRPQESPAITAEFKLRNILLASTYSLIDPIQMFREVGQLLWNKEAAVFECPYRHCSGKSSKRLKIVGHYINKHSSDCGGDILLPFVCHTCDEKFKCLTQMLSHVSERHHNPRCACADQLKEAIRNEGE